LGARRGFAGDPHPQGKDPAKPSGQEEGSSLAWTAAFSAIVLGAIGFTVWQEVDGHETQNAQREANRRSAEERERREALQREEQEER
jgi:hypothetical protein